MKNLFRIAVIAGVLGSLSILSSQFNSTAESHSATCTGSTPCNACKNCKYCGHCAKGGGKCGVCKKKA